MTYNFDPNKYKNIFDQMFGAGAFDQGIERARNLGHLQAQVDLAKTSYNQRMNAAKKASEHKTYNDAVNYINSNKDQILNNDPTDQNKTGAYRVAEEIRNDPNKQADIKAQGFNVNDYINALYNAASGGKFRSEREYNQYVGNLKDQISARDKAYQDKHGMTQDEAYQLQKKTEKKQSTKKKQSLLGEAIDFVEKPLHGFMNTLNEAVKVGKYNAQHYKPGQQPTQSLSKIAKDFKQGTNTQVGGADVLNTMGVKNEFAKNAIGSSMDLFLDPVNLVGLGVASKVAKMANVAGKVEKGAKALGAGEKLSKLAGISAKGGTITGGASAIQQGADAIAHPDQESLKQRLINVGFNFGAGAVADPLLHGLMGGLRTPKAELLPKQEVSPKQEPLGLPSPKITGYLNEGQKALPSPMRLNEPMQVNQPVGQPFIQGAKKTVNPYAVKFEQLVKDFNELQAQGKIPAGKEVEVAREMWNNMASEQDPSFEKMLSLANDRHILSQQQKVDLIKQARKNQNAAVYGVDNITNNLKLTQPTERVPLQYTAKGLNPNLMVKQVPQEIPPLNFSKKIAVDSSHPSINQPLNTHIKQTMNEVAPTKQVENISPETGQLHKLTKNEQARMKNQDTFAQNNLDKRIPDTSGHIVSKIDKPKEQLVPVIKDKLSQHYVGNIDDVYRIKQFTDNVRKARDGKLDPSKDPYMLAINTRSADRISHQILNYNMLDKEGNVVGKSLSQVVRQIPKNEVKKFLDYIVNKHAITRMQRGEKVFPDEMKMSPEKSAYKVKQYEKKYPHFKEISKDFTNFYQDLGQNWLVGHGLIPESEWKGYLKNNPDYIANERYFSNLEKNNPINNKAGSDFANQNKQVKKGVGSQRPIINPIETAIERTDSYVKAGRRNEVMQAIIHNLKENPDALKGWAEIVPTEEGAGVFADSIGNLLKDKGIDDVIAEFNKAFDQKPDLTHGNIVSGLVDGKIVKVRIHDPQFLDALTNLSPKALPKWLKAASKVTRSMKTLTTGLNLSFSLLRNIWRDIPQAYINSKTTDNPFAYTKDLVSAIMDVAGNKEAYQSFKNFGGGHASPISTDINLLDQSKRKIMGNLDTSLKGKIMNAYDSGISKIENLSNMVESAPRLAEYKRITKNSNNYNEKIKGLYEANDITVNFNRHGENIKHLDTIIPYLNAAVQGLDKFVRVYKDNPKEAIAKSVLAVTIPSILSYTWNQSVDPKGYEDLPAYVKDSNLLFALGDGKFVKIPLPREVGMIFAALPQRLLESWGKENPDAFRGFSTSMLDNFLPPTRFITQPINDLRANKDFANRPIVPGDLAGLSPRYQYDQNTSSVSKLIGDKLNVSPKKLDYLGKSYLGVIGQLGIPATSENGSLGDRMKNTVGRQVIADSVYSNDKVSQFYDELNKLDTAQKDFKAEGIRTKDFNDPLRKQFDKTEQNISNVRKLINVIQKDQTLDSKTKQEKLRELQKTINSLAIQALKSSKIGK